MTPPAGEPVDAYVSGGVLYVNWQGDSFKAGDTITIAFGAPEASTWTMMALGFACLGAAAFRRRAGAPTALFKPVPNAAWKQANLAAFRTRIALWDGTQKGCAA